MLKPTLEDLLAAFEEIREPNPAGALYRPADAEAVVRMVTNRSKELGGHIRQLVRLVRLAALCSEKTYVEFFHAVRTLRTSGFADVVSRAIADRRIPETRIRIEANRVVFVEPTMAAKTGEAYDLTFGQLPKLAILHHVLRRFLHYPRLYNGQAAHDPAAPDEDKGLFWPIVIRNPEVAADVVAAKVQSCLNQYLSEVFDSSTTAARQVQVITGFLNARPAEVSAGAISGNLLDRIDNQLLFDFWETQALAAEEGFRLFRSAATKMLRYRRACMGAQVECQQPLRIGDSTEEGAIDLERLEAATLDIGDWQSPMVVLTPLCDEVKFLNAAERLDLANYLDGCVGDGADDADEESRAGQSGSSSGAGFRMTLVREYATASGGALMGKDRFDLKFVPTLLRADVFHAPQHAIQLDAGRAGDDDIAGALESIGENSYRARRENYVVIREQTKSAMLASLHILGTLGDLNALVLVRRLSDQSTVDYFTGFDPGADPDDEDEFPEDADPLSDHDRKSIAARLRSAFADIDRIDVQSVKDLVLEARRTAGQLRRNGFRREQWQNDVSGHLSAVHAEAAGELVRLVDDLDRLIRHLDRLDAPRGSAPGTPARSLAEAATADRQAFARVFRDIYVGSAGMAASTA